MVRFEGKNRLQNSSGTYRVSADVSAPSWVIDIVYTKATFDVQNGAHSWTDRPYECGAKYGSVHIVGT